MVDIYLQEILKVPGKQKPNRFMNSVYKDIDETITNFQETESKLESSQARLLKLKIEIKDELKLPEIGPRIQKAINIIYDNKNFEDKEIMDELSTARDIIDEMEETELINENLKTVLGISDESIGMIFQLALTHLDNDELENSLSLFVLLFILVPENLDYFYRAGLVAQMSGHYDFAITLYSACRSPEFVEANLLTADCYISLNEKEKASEILSEINQNLQNNPLSEIQNKMLSDLNHKIECL